MDATPFEQEELLEATKLTDWPTVLPLPGLDMLTPAKAGTDTKPYTKMQIARRASFFKGFSPVGIIWSRWNRLAEGSHPTFRQETLIVLAADQETSLGGHAGVTERSTYNVYSGNLSVKRKSP
jgi:hypothetical protein